MPIVTLFRVRVAFVAPATFIQPLPLLTSHWNVGAGIPMAATLNVALLPTCTLWLVGWLVMLGASLTVGIFSNVAFTSVAPAVLTKVTEVEPTVFPVNAVTPVAVTPFAISLWFIGGVMVTVIVSPTAAVDGLTLTFAETAEATVTG